MEALDPQRECKAAPGPNSIASAFPEEDGNSATCDACDGAREDKQAAQCATRRIDGRDDAELENEHNAYK